jgi:hypothetical protein
VTICNRLIEVAPIATPERVLHVPAVPTEPVAVLQAGLVLGDLDGVWITMKRRSGETEL